jgi:hypothetical protein
MEIEGASRGQSGAVTVVQRVSANLKLNPHLHAVVLDGVFVAGLDGNPVFHVLPRISDIAVADLLQIIRARLLRYLVRRHVVEDDGEGQTRFLADDLAEREPALVQLAAAAVSGLPPAGPELRRKPLTFVLPPSDGPKLVRPLCVEDGGLSLHAATRVGAEDDEGRTNLLKYVLRPPIAQEHVTLTDEGLVAIQLNKPFRDGTVSVERDPLSLVSRLAASVHPPKFHTLRYGGILAPHGGPWWFRGRSRRSPRRRPGRPVTRCPWTRTRRHHPLAIAVVAFRGTCSCAAGLASTSRPVLAVGGIPPADLLQGGLAR